MCLAHILRIIHITYKLSAVQFFVVTVLSLYVSAILLNYMLTKVTT